MEKLITLEAVAAALPFDNLDTDQLMPKQFLRGIDKSGLAKGMLYNMRHRPDGTVNPDFILNRPGHEETKILVAGPNFGCGSSREHAVWGLMQYGIRAVIAPSFGEIFYSNCFNNGLLAARVTPEACLRFCRRRRRRRSRCRSKTARSRRPRAKSSRLRSGSATARCSLKGSTPWRPR